MPRFDEASQANLPSGPDQQGWRHWGDGKAGHLVAARMQGFYASGADYRDVAVDINGNLLAALTTSTIEIGTVDQGTAGATAWKVDGSAVTQPVSGTFWQLTQPVSIASMPSTPVTGSLGRSWTLSSGTDSVSASVSNFPATQAVSNAGTFAVQSVASQSGNWLLAGSDGVTTQNVSARVHNGFTHLYVRDTGVIAVLSELLWEIQQLNLVQEN